MVVVTNFILVYHMYVWIFFSPLNVMIPYLASKAQCKYLKLFLVEAYPNRTVQLSREFLAYTYLGHEQIDEGLPKK